jgi:hypothetical protein
MAREKSLLSYLWGDNWLPIRGSTGPAHHRSKIRQLTDVLHCKLQQYFPCNHVEHGKTCSELPRGDGHTAINVLPGQLRPAHGGIR